GRRGCGSAARGRHRSAREGSRSDDGDVATHRVRAELNVGSVPLRRQIGDGQLGADLAAPRPCVYPQRRAFADPDLQVTGSRLEIDLALRDRADRLVARGGVRVHGRQGFADEHVAGRRVHLEPVPRFADLNVARGRVDPRLAADRCQLHVARCRIDAGLAADPGKLDVAARGVDLRVAGDVAELHVARAALDLDRSEPAPALDVRRAGLGANARLLRAMDLDEDVRSPE